MMADFERENLAVLNFQRAATREFSRQKNRNYASRVTSVNHFCILD